jgi:hypothetical protein
MARALVWLLGAKRFFLVARYYDDGNNKPDANTQASPTRGAHPPNLRFPSLTTHTNTMTTRVNAMPATELIERTEPVVVPRAHATSTRSRLPWFLRVPILLVLNLGIKTMLWSVAGNFLVPELGRISKIPTEEDVWSLYSPAARIAMNAATIAMNWYFNYDCEYRAVYTMRIDS